MRPSSAEKKQRCGQRQKGVLPVRVKGTDSSGSAFEELAHTLDVTPTGARLGAIRRQLNVLDEITVFYRQHKRQYRVVWTKKLKGTSEFQVGLQAVAQAAEAFGPGSPDYKLQASPRSAVPSAPGA
jgi:hypothetical protein